MFCDVYTVCVHVHVHVCMGHADVCTDIESVPTSAHDPSGWGV